MYASTRVLPARPDLDHLRRQARELLDACRRGDIAALAEIRTHYHGAPPRRRSRCTMRNWCLPAPTAIRAGRR